MIINYCSYIIYNKKIHLNIMNKHFNEKRFLLPNSHRSMSCYHAKILDDNIMKLTIHDCHKSIQLKNDLNNIEEIDEAVEKLTNLKNGIDELISYIKENYNKNISS